MVKQQFYIVISTKKRTKRSIQNTPNSIHGILTFTSKTKETKLSEWSQKDSQKFLQKQKKGTITAPDVLATEQCGRNC